MAPTLVQSVRCSKKPSVGPVTIQKSMSVGNSVGGVGGVGIGSVVVEVAQHKCSNEMSRIAIYLRFYKDKMLQQQQQRKQKQFKTKNKIKHKISKDSFQKSS
ncbi:Hypothetical predicted protein [Octopus vulgaris]|uniref:Uncharacterized protein n=1 Tax=Octopus vulgaris TaxID=6645 RepID=A0AA36AMV8_OCTVU|nr:Hypothetical predicted protein [Octopus vulgaris]